MKALLLISFFIFNPAFIAQKNVVPLKGKPIILKNWLIAKDTVTKEILTIHSEKLWKPIQSISNSSRYDTGIWLLKTDLEIRDSVDGINVLGLFAKNLISSYEIYWDGNKITQNGTIGINRVTEQPGKFLFNIALPKNTTSVGEHTIIVRISNHRNDSAWKWYYGGLEIGPYETGLSAYYKTFYQSFIFMGLLCIPFLFNIFLYFARNRKPEHLLFSLICLIVLLDSTTAAAPAFMNLSTTYIHLQYYIYNVITLLFSILLPVFFVYFFSFSRKLILPIVALNISVMVLFTNLFSIFSIMSFMVLILSSVIVGWSVKKKKENSLLILFGIAAAWISYLFNMAFIGLASIMVICVSISIARQFAKSERAESEANLKSARLENELLKKNINPHFLLNSLTSIIVWLRKDPKSAIKLIEALAYEFRMITQISGLKQIPIQQEIELCRTHLKIMNYRKGADFHLESVDIVEEENVPPMIFHTLIENGLTHGYENKSRGTFTLQRQKNSDCVQYILSNDGDFCSEESKYSSGFGMKYIESRLEESYPGRWKISSHSIKNGWETIIDLKEEK